MTLEQLINLFQRICTEHPKINSFHTGLNFEHNDTNILYPALRLLFPYKSTFAQDNKVIEYEFTMTLFVNDLEEKVMDSSKYVNTNYMVQDSTLDESIGDITDENKLRDRALGITNQVLETLLEQESVLDYFNVTGYNIKALERANNDFVTGSQLTVKIRTQNTYRCEYPNLLKD